MNKLMDEVIEIIVTACGLEETTIDPTTNLVSDLGIDSIDFLDATYDIDQRYGIKLPIEDWMEEVNLGEAELSDYFILDNFVDHIAKLTKAVA